jgi:hypothetical protein
LPKGFRIRGYQREDLEKESMPERVGVDIVEEGDDLELVAVEQIQDLWHILTLRYMLVAVE